MASRDSDDDDDKDDDDDDNDDDDDDDKDDGDDNHVDHDDQGGRVGSVELGWRDLRPGTVGKWEDTGSRCLKMSLSLSAVTFILSCHI